MTAGNWISIAGIALSVSTTVLTAVVVWAVRVLWGLSTTVTRIDATLLGMAKGQDGHADDLKDHDRRLRALEGAR